MPFVQHQPPEAFDAILADMREGRCSQLSCSIKLSPFLTDAWYVPASEPATIGLLKQGKYDHGSNRGWLQSVTWAPVGSLPEEKTSLLHSLEDEEGKRLPTQHDEEEGDAGIAMPSPRQLVRDAMQPAAILASDASNTAIVALATAMRRGFWMLLILILLVAIVR